MTSAATLRSQIVTAQREVVRSDLKVSIGPRGNLNSALIEKLNGSDEWTEDAIRFIAADITGQVIQAQQALNNPIEELYVDGSAAKPVMQMDRNIVSVFDKGRNARQIMDSLLSNARQRIPNVRWKWRVGVGSSSSLSELTEMVRSGGPVFLNTGDRIYLIPASTNMSSGIDATFGNILYRYGMRPDARGRLKKVGSRRSKGYFALTTASVRPFARRSGFNVRSFQSNENATSANRRLPSGVTAGTKSNTKSQFTGKSKYYQGIYGFVISTMPTRRR